MPPRMRTRSARRPVAESRGGETGERVGRGRRGKGPKGGNDERVDKLNGQGNDQGVGANGGVKGVNRNIEGINGGVGGAPDFSTIIAQQLQNLLPAILAQVGNQGNVGNQNGNVVNENVQEKRKEISFKRGGTLHSLYASREIVVLMSRNDFKFNDDRKFHELVRLVPYLVTLESRNIERYVFGLAPQIRGMVAATEPKTMQKVVQISGALTDEAVRNGSIKKVRRNMKSYTDRFHELARLVPHLVTLESRKIERYVFGLAPQIRGMVATTEPKTMQKVVQISGVLTDEAVRNGSIKKVKKR
ncbi:hypothetical protein Tco_0822907 [Tanacetum coccineum]|uniref:Uncharacterized protein n=1 Tax=Tanacetum coccineum TaxID=301880 RepID=A0ABQ5AKL4_9ASTR